MNMVIALAFVVPIVAEQNLNQFLLLHWQSVVMTFGFASAFKIAVLYVETNESELPVSFHLLSVAILLIFLSFFLVSFIGHRFAATARIVAGLVVATVSTAVVFTLAIPFPLALKCGTWALYAVTLFTVFICGYRF